MKQPEDTKTTDLFKSYDQLRTEGSNLAHKLIADPTATTEQRLVASKWLMTHAGLITRMAEEPLPGRVQEALMSARQAMKELEDAITETLKGKQ